MDRIRFGHKVTRIQRAADYAQTGQWTVCWQTIPDGKEEEDMFHCVLLAVGHHSRPITPCWPGIERFQGRVLHSHEFRRATHEDEDRVAVVVGAGDSATDMAVELSRVAKQVSQSSTKHYYQLRLRDSFPLTPPRKVMLSTRRGTWVLKKCARGGVPVDTLFTTRFNALLARYGPRAFTQWRLTQMAQQYVDHAMYALMPHESLLDSQFFTVNEELPGRILAGLVTVKPDIRQFTETGNRVVLDPFQTSILSSTIPFLRSIALLVTFIPFVETIFAIPSILIHFLWSILISFILISHFIQFGSFFEFRSTLNHFLRPSP